MSLKDWETNILDTPGAPERVAEIEDELRLAARLTALREQAGMSSANSPGACGCRSPGWQRSSGPATSRSRSSTSTSKPSAAASKSPSTEETSGFHSREPTKQHTGRDIPAAGIHLTNPTHH